MVPIDTCGWSNHCFPLLLLLSAYHLSSLDRTLKQSFIRPNSKSKCSLNVLTLSRAFHKTLLDSYLTCGAQPRPNPFEPLLDFLNLLAVNSQVILINTQGNDDKVRQESLQNYNEFQNKTSQKKKRTANLFA